MAQKQSVGSYPIDQARDLSSSSMSIKRKIRVAMVTPSFPTQEGEVRGGVEGVSLYLSQALAEIPEIDLHVIVPLASPGCVGQKEIYGLQVHLLEHKSSKTKVVSLIDIGEMLQVIKSLNADIVHFQGLPTWANQCSLPHVVTIHGISERDVLYKGSFISSRIKYIILRFIEGRARRKSRNVISINPYVRKFLGSPRNQRVWDIANPVSKEFFTISHQPLAGRIFSASCMIQRKNIHGLIRAFSQIADDHPNVELRLAGSDQESDYGCSCRSLVNTLGLNERVKFLGILSVEQIREELSLAACFALCSFQETAPLSISEAMAVGVPVVASNVCGVPWMVEDVLTGILIDPMKVENIAQGLSQVLFSNIGAKMESAAKKNAKDLFFPAEVARKTFDAYMNIIDHPLL